jgi:ATP-dependent DNA helicase RecQ
VGRAGRNEELYLNAGFSEKNPIRTNCIIAKDDFKNSKDRLHGNQITWGHIGRIQKTIYDYVNRFSKKEVTIDQAFALPTDLLAQYAEYSGKEYDETFFRVVLYWLERLNKIKLGTYTPTHIPLTIFAENQNYSVIKNEEDVGKIRNLYSKINTGGDSHLSSKGNYMVQIEDLKIFLQVDNIKEVWRLLFLAQKAGVLKVEREIIIEPTIKRENELDNWDSRTTSPTIETAFAFTKNIMYASKYNQQTHFQGDQLDSFAKKAMQEYLIPSRVYWKEFTKKDNKERSRDNIAKNLQDDFIKKRAKVAFKLINFAPECKHKSILQHEKGYDKPMITQLVFNGYKNSKDWEDRLKDFKKDLYALIKHVHNRCIRHDIHKYNIVDLLLKLDLESKGEEYFKQLIFVAKGLGYLKGNAGGLVPMGIELFILDKNIIENDNLNEFEKNIKSEFDESNRMKVLRLLSLECLASYVKLDKYDEFIKAYFRCATETDFVKLLEEHLGENNELLNAFRVEALKKAIKSLNVDQRKVYNAPISENLQVIAGPGSGKTHTLTLRVARLIQDEKINPDNILVLAYNRAVVVELKDRLNRLFKELGYAKLIKRLKVFTFHGFCKYVLANDIDGINFDHWTTQFLEVADDSPGKISQKLGSIKYVFVDEFQDITGQRLELLKFIAKPNETKLCVIGDPNQSIYGYERVNEGGSRSPKDNYDDFNAVYKPIELPLSQNYISYPDILSTAEKLIKANKETFKLISLKSKLSTTQSNYVEFIKCDEINNEWLDKLASLIQEVNSETGNKYRQVALMFRSNIEVFSAHCQIQEFIKTQKIDPDKIRIRIQGEGEDFTRIREIAWILEAYKNAKEKIISYDFITKYKNYQSKLRIKFPNWDTYYFELFEYLLLEFQKQKEENSTYKDLLEFIEEVAQKDDGQLSKIYYSHLKEENRSEQKIEIILTTMHKVKGLEFDAVIIPSSIANIELKKKDLTKLLAKGFTEKQALQEYVEEERRIYYVAYTRAKYRLIVYWGKREEALKSSSELIFDEKQFGVSIPSGFDKHYIGWGATETGNNIFNFIHQYMKAGLSLGLIRPNTFWLLEVDGKRIGCLSKEFSTSLTNQMNGQNQLKGFVCSNIYKWTYKETVDYDNTHQDKHGNKTTYATGWTDEAKQRGYIYLIEFSGYGKK